MKSGTPIFRATAAALLVSTSACYATRPLADVVPPPETRVLATLTDSGTVVMGGLIGTGATGVEGLVSSADADAWELRLLKVEHRDGRSVQWNQEVVRFPRSVLTGAVSKQIDTKRSVLAGVLIVAGATLASGLFAAASDSDEGGDPPPPPAARVPVSLPFR